jgi:hypothetical protein
MTQGDGWGGTPGGASADSTARGTAKRLARLFERHLSRDGFADGARVVVRDGDDGRYEYVAGVHYVTDVDDRARDRVESFAADRGLEVVMDGRNGFAFRHGTPAADADAHVAGAIVQTVFDETYTDLADVVEVLDASTTLSWHEIDGQPA